MPPRLATPAPPGPPQPALRFEQSLRRQCPVEHQGVVRELEAVPLRDLHLATLDRRVNELDDLTAVGAHDVVVVLCSPESSSKTA